MEERRHSESSARETRGSCSRALHFTAFLDEKRGLCRFVCDSQPLMTLTSHGNPKRCPLCGQNYPIRNETRSMRGEQDARQQG